MEAKRKARGSWGVRLFILVLSVIFGILLFWLLGFVTRDIDTIPGPDFKPIRLQYVGAEMDAQREGLQKEKESLSRKIQELHDQQRLLRDSTDSLQKTIEQLLTLQGQSLAKNVEFTEQSKQTLREGQSAFLDNQKKYELANQQLAELMQQLRDTEDKLAGVNESIKEKEQQANMEYQQLWDRHRMKVAAMKLGFLVPLFLIMSWIFMKYRTGSYWPMVWAGFVTVFIKIALVVHECFPTRYFKYIAILVVMGIVVRILIVLIRMIVSPKKDLLIRQYQQDYDKHICPICSKPISIGPLRYLGGLRKKMMVVIGQEKESVSPQVYACPSCGTSLYDKCEKCGGVRHTLLPYCEHCGNEKKEV